ncbi:MAG: sensor of ECF-type sigma factor [Flavobacterium sp.]
MKHITFLSLFIILVSMNSQAQDPPKISKEKREQIKSLKVAFITSKLALTPEESAKFWPIYNTFEDKQHQIRKQKFKGYLNRMNDESFEKISEKEAATLLAQMEKTEDELHQNRKKLVADLKGTIPSVKILKLKKAEEEFNRKLLKQYRDKRQK